MVYRLFGHIPAKLACRQSTPRPATFYTCDVCGRNTWKSNLPLPLLIASVLFILFIIFMGFYAIIELKDMEGLIIFPFGLYAGYIFYKNYVSNAKHWRSLHKWAKAHRQQAKSNYPPTRLTKRAQSPRWPSSDTFAFHFQNQAGLHYLVS